MALSGRIYIRYPPMERSILDFDFDVGPDNPDDPFANALN